MAEPTYRTLRIVLLIFSLLLGVGSLLMILSGKLLMMRILMRPPESEVSTLLLFMIREMGGLFVMFSVLHFGLLGTRSAMWQSLMPLSWACACSP